MSAGAQGVGSLSGGQQLQYVPLAAFDKKRSSFYGGADSSSDDDGDEDGEAEAEEEGGDDEEGGEESAEEGRSDGEDKSDDDDDDDGDDEEEEEGEGGWGDEMRGRRRSGRTAPRYESEDSEDESDDAGRSIFTFNRKKRAKKGQSLEEEQHGYGEMAEVGQEEEEEEEEEVVEEAGVGTVAAAVDEEALKQMRLQKLLAKTDRIVNNINMSMTRYLEKEQAAEAAAAAAAAAAAEAEAAIDGNDEFGAPFSKPSIWPAVAATLQPFGLKQGLVQSPYSQLRDYQQGGVEWLRSLHIQGLNGILADEMGKFVYSLDHSCSQPF